MCDQNIPYTVATRAILSGSEAIPPRDAKRGESRNAAVLCLGVSDHMGVAWVGGSISSPALKLKRRWSDFQGKYKPDNVRYTSPVFDPTVKPKKTGILVNVFSYLGKAISRKHAGDSEDEDSETSTERDTASETEEGGNRDVLLQRALEKILENRNELTQNEEISLNDLRKKRLQYFAPNKKKAIFNWKKNTTSAQDLDDDLKYLMSFTGELKNMTHQQKLDFKLGMMQLLRKIYNNPPY